MKTIRYITQNVTGVVVGFVLMLLFVVSGFLALRNNPSQMAAAAVAESRNSVETVDGSDAIMDDDRVESPVAEVRAEPAARVIGSGEASFYGPGFAGRPTANGERFDPSAMTAAHRTLPFGSKVRVTNEANGRAIVVRVNDRGPYAHGRVIDVSRGAAEKLGMIHSGTANVKLELLS